jgi:hypothetical protein
VPLILLEEPLEVEDWVSLSLDEVLLFFFDLLPELAADWSLEAEFEEELPVSLEDVLGTDEEELPFDVVSVEELGVEDELELGLEVDDGLCVLPLL